MVDFLPVLYDFLLEFINIGAEYIRGLAGEAQGWVGGGKTLIKEKRRHKYRIAGKFVGGRFGELTRFEHVAK